MKILAWLFGCRHRQYSFPITNRETGETHVCCLECGQEFAYDWQKMKRAA